MWCVPNTAPAVPIGHPTHKTGLHLIYPHMQRLPRKTTPLTMSHACHAIRRLSPLDAALTLRFARLPRKATLQPLMPQQNQRIDTRHGLLGAQNEHCTRLPQIFALCDLYQQNRRFPTNFPTQARDRLPHEPGYATFQTSKSNHM